MFDPIRHYPWFRKCAERNANLSTLMCAAQFWIQHGTTRKAVAEDWGVNANDLGYCRLFIENESRLEKMDQQMRRQYQGAINHAYHNYVNQPGNPFNFYLSNAARLYGLEQAKLLELWDIDPKFYPTAYNV